MDEEEYSSDTSDEDYQPGGEEQSAGDDSADEDLPEGQLADGEESDQKGKKKKKLSKKKNDTSTLARERTGGIVLEDANHDEASTEAVPASDSADNYNKELGQHIEAEKEARKEQDEKNKADALWADFMKDTGPVKPKPKSNTGLGSLTSLSKPVSKPIPTTQTTSPAKSTTAPKPSKVTITTEYDFAGELVKITKEVDVNSKEAKAEQKKLDDKKIERPSAGPSLAGLKRPGGGLGSVLGKIEKKQKMSTLEKSKLDWNSFKQKEGITEELDIHNRGKAGYLERQAFLERTDHRQFEIERDLRLSSSSKR